MLRFGATRVGFDATRVERLRPRDASKFKMESMR
jgi:hypothetical protein